MRLSQKVDNRNTHSNSPDEIEPEKQIWSTEAVTLIVLDQTEPKSNV
jgi:hypothetical protein